MNKETHKHFNGVCEKEYDRGYAFGREDSYKEILDLVILQHGALSEDFVTDQVLLRISKETLITLWNQVKRNL